MRSQGQAFYGRAAECIEEALSAAGAEVDGLIVDGALHESTFWSQNVLDRIWAFIDRYLAR